MSEAMNFDQLVTLCQRTHEELSLRAARAVDAHLVVRNWLFGHYIAEFEQRGADRAEYGARLLASLANHLKPLKIKGSSVTRLKLYRSFYRIFPIGPTLSDQSEPLLPKLSGKSPTASDLLTTDGLQIQPTLSAELLKRFPLGWSHYVELLTHQDLGQMQMYVNYFDRHMKLPDELPTIGIVLCHRKNDALVELTLPESANIFASKYQLYLPSKEELKARLEQITQELEGGETP